VPGSTNQTSSNDPSLMNNTCNKDITAGNVTLRALDLHGDTTPSYSINSTNFTVDIETGGVCTGGSCIECDGSRLSNNSYATITGSTMPSGNNSLNYGNATSGQEQLYYCLTDVNSGLMAQQYSTNTLGSWTLQVL